MQPKRLLIFGFIQTLFLYTQAQLIRTTELFISATAYVKMTDKNPLKISKTTINSISDGVNKKDFKKTKYEYRFTY